MPKRLWMEIKMTLKSNNTMMKSKLSMINSMNNKTSSRDKNHHKMEKPKMKLKRC